MSDQKEQPPTPPPRTRPIVRVFRADRYGQIYVREEPTQGASPQVCAQRRSNPPPRLKASLDSGDSKSAKGLEGY